MKRSLVAAVSAILVASCGRVIPAIGPSNEIVVICDGGEQSKAGRLMKELLKKEIFTVENEPAFKVAVLGEEGFDVVRERKVVFLLGNWRGGRVKQFIESQLPGEVSRGVMEVQTFEDVWAKWQAVMVLMAPTPRKLVEEIQKSADEIYLAAESAVKERLRRSIFSEGERLELEEKLSRKLGWSFRIPLYYEGDLRYVGNGFASFRAEDPPRMIFVFWKDAEKSELRSDYMIELRDWAGEHFYEGDRVEHGRDILVDDDVEFAGFQAIKVTGTWGNEKYMIGGPFRTYGFYSESQHRLYLVDVAVYLPGRKKAGLLREVEAVAETFRISEEIEEPEGALSEKQSS